MYCRDNGSRDCRLRNLGTPAGCNVYRAASQEHRTPEECYVPMVKDRITPKRGEPLPPPSGYKHATPTESGNLPMSNTPVGNNPDPVCENPSPVCSEPDVDSAR